jgi:penicillin-binding protein 2
MFIFDAFKREARRLRAVSVVMAAGLLALLTGLWFVQIVSGKQMRGKMEYQSFRTIAVPAVRGRILDRTGTNALADNKAQYNVAICLEELRGQFEYEYTNHVLPEYTNHLAEEYRRLHPGSAKLPAGAAKVPAGARPGLKMEAKYNVVSNLSARVGALLQQTVALDAARFRHFDTNYTYVPMQILTNLNAEQIARFSEQLSNVPGLELETEPVRNYPHKDLAAHLLGYARPTGGDRKYLPANYAGEAGLEQVFDEQLRGQEGEDLVLVNNQNYRQREETLSPNHLGGDLCLTLDLPIQRAAQQALSTELPNIRGAAVVMDVHSGDVLAMVSVPAFDPNEFVRAISPARFEQLNDPKMKPQANRATFEAYPPGSTFKIITAIAGLESGVMDPEEIYHSPANPLDPSHGIFNEQGYHIKDLAPPGDYDFERAFYHSSNSYFCHYGMKAGLRKLLEVAKRFHLGEKTGFAARQEVAGIVPRPEQAGKSMPLNSAPYVAIGQEITVTPLQMAVMVAAIANGGTIFWPRIVSSASSPETGEVEELYAKARVRDQVQLNPQHLQLIRAAMLQDTEHEGANAYAAFHYPGSSAPYLPNFHVAGKTGTAEVDSEELDYKTVTWFDSFGPYENPRYAVVVMILDGGFGATHCAPVARKIYQAIVREEQTTHPKPALAGN